MPDLARTLVGLGAKVTILDSLIPQYGGNRRNVHGLERKLDINLSDVRDRHSLPAFLRGQHFLFNLAGQTSHMDSMTDPETDLEINCRAQLTLLEACRRHNPQIRVVPRPKKDDSAEVYIGEEFIGVLFVDDEDDDKSYNFQMAILETDLEP